jgi:predicted nucleotidyltransferase
MKPRPKRTPRPQQPTGVADALFSKVQQRVLAVLFGSTERSFYANEIIGLAQSGTGAVQRELARLEVAGIVTTTRVGNQKHYQANSKSPLFEELRGLARKTFGLTDVLRAALQPIAYDIAAAFVYGSIAKGLDTATSDIDVMVVSDRVSYSELFALLEAVSARLGRKIAPTIYSADDFRARVRSGNSFLVRILEQPKLWLIGGEGALPA